MRTRYWLAKFCAIMISASVIPPAPGLAFFGGATEWTQILNNAELIGIAGQSAEQVQNQLTQIGQLAQQIQNQIQIYENMLQNTMQLPNHVWGQVESDFTQLQSLVNQGQGIAFSMGSLDDVLKQRFQSFAEFKTGLANGEDFSSSYQQWSDTNRDTIASTRDGRLVATDKVADVTPEIMIRHLVGREVSTLYPPKPAAAPGKVLLEVAGLGDGARITDVSFSLRQGEILGMAGLIGSGRTETMECLCGLRPATTGNIRLLGEPFSPKRYPDAIAKGLVYLSENRKSDGVFLSLPIDQNISALDLGAVSTIYRFIDRRKELQQAEEACRKLSIKTSGTAQRVSELSGGNQQKVAIAKLLAVAPKVILMDEPTRGIDVNAKAEVHRLLRQLVEEGIGVIVVSSEIQEIVGLCDRVLVMYEGQPRGTLEGDDVTEDNIVQLAAGMRSTRPHHMEMVS